MFSSCTDTKSVSEWASVHIKDGNFGAISVTERRAHLESGISDGFCATL